VVVDPVASWQAGLGSLDTSIVGAEVGAAWVVVPAEDAEAIIDEETVGIALVDTELDPDTVALLEMLEDELVPEGPED
jgi:hypothetical protein